jgi:hypothetical protein
MSDHVSPLAGLTREQADQAIECLQAKIEAQEDSLAASRDHLDQMIEDRDDLEDPQEPATSNGVTATAGVAEGFGEVN